MNWAIPNPAGFHHHPGLAGRFVSRGFIPRFFLGGLIRLALLGLLGFPIFAFMCRWRDGQPAGGRLADTLENDIRVGDKVNPLNWSCSRPGPGTGRSGGEAG